jgi:hypothetical protein
MAVSYRNLDEEKWHLKNRDKERTKAVGVHRESKEPRLLHHANSTSPNSNPETSSPKLKNQHGLEL